MSGHHAVAFDDQIFIFGGDEGAQNAYCRSDPLVHS